jgi:uncharacterized membrane protein
VITPTYAASSPSVSPLQTVGQYHSIVAWIPIGLLGVLFLFELVLFFKKKDTNGGWGQRLLIATAISFIPVVTLGVIRAYELYSKTPLSHSFVLHRNFEASSFALVLLSLSLRVIKQNELFGKVRSVYLKALFLALLLAVFGTQH